MSQTTAHTRQTAPTPQAAPTTPTVTAVTLAGLAAGFAGCTNVVHDPGWVHVPSGAFETYQDASVVRTVPSPAVPGLSSLAVAILLAWRGLVGGAALVAVDCGGAGCRAVGGDRGGPAAD